jgi:hypothetical protein
VARTTCCPGGRRPQEVAHVFPLRPSRREFSVASCALRAPGQQVVRATMVRAHPAQTSTSAHGPLAASQFPSEKHFHPAPGRIIFKTRDGPSVADRFYGQIPKWPTGEDCKSSGFAFTGSNPVLPTSPLMEIKRRSGLFLLSKHYPGLSNFYATCRSHSWR